MLRAMSSYVFVKERLHPGHLDAMVRGGAQAVEIFGARDHFDYTNRQHVGEIAAWFQDGKAAFHSMHSPMYPDYEWGRSGAPAVNIADREKKRRIEAMDEIKRALEVAERLPFKFLIQHIGTSNEVDLPEKFENTLTSIEHLHAFAKPLGVTLLLENIPNELSTAEKLMEYVAVGHFADVGFCFDIGHALIAGKLEAEFDMMRPRIRSTHLHDNLGDRDSHLWPGEGKIDWKQAMALLQSAPQVPPLLMEIEGSELTSAQISEKMSAAFKLMETAGMVRA